jgi:hypothetical protein
MDLARADLFCYSRYFFRVGYRAGEVSIRAGGGFGDFKFFCKETVFPKPPTGFAAAA